MNGSNRGMTRGLARTSALDLVHGDYVLDTADDMHFTVDTVRVDGAVARIVTADGHKFRYGGMYRGLKLLNYQAWREVGHYSDK